MPGGRILGFELSVGIIYGRFDIIVIDPAGADYFPEVFF